MDKSANVIYLITLKKTWSRFNHMKGWKEKKRDEIIPRTKTELFKESDSVNRQRWSFLLKQYHC